MYICTIHSFDNLTRLKEAGASAVLVGVPHFSVRHCIEVAFDELYKWKQECDRLGLKLYVNFLRMFMEEDMTLVRDCLSNLKDVNVDGIYYADEGVLYEAIQLSIQDRLIYQPETLVASSHDVAFYLDQGIQSVSLAHELSLDEICSIASKTSNIEVLIHGHFSIMYSRRALVTNYLDAINKSVEVNNKRFDLIEQTRQERMPVVQDEAGTHIYSSDPISSFEELKMLQDVGITRFRIDSLFFDDNYACEVLQAYQNQRNLELGSNRWYHEMTTKKKEEL